MNSKTDRCYTILKQAYKNLLKPKNSPIVHCDLKPDMMRYDLEDNIMKYVARIQAKVVDLHEAAIVDAVIAEAKAAGITDLYLLDRDFVIEALTEKMMFERRGKFE